MNTTLIEPTFESIAKSAKFITVKKTNYAPLPCEKGFEIKGDENIVRLTERFPVLDMSFMQQTYFDEEHKINMPIFAAVDVRTGKVDSMERLFGAGIGIIPKLNPKLSNLSIKKFNKKLLFKVGLGGVITCPIGYFMASTLNGQPISAYTLFTGMFFFLGGFAVKGYIDPFSKESIFEKQEDIKSFSYQFEGQIPDDVRAIYHEEKSNFDSIHLICDAKNRWISETRPLPPPNPDPLLVGVKKLKSGKDLVFLLAKFDLTPAEQYVADEFAV